MEKINFYLNTTNHQYNFGNEELLAFTEANVLFDKNYLLYVLYEMYNAIFAHLLRRIEFFGIDTFLSDFDQNGSYDNSQENLFKRWESFHENDLFIHAHKHNIIDEICLHLLFAIHRSKQNFHQTDTVEEKYLISFLHLFESTLFSKQFIKSKEQLNRRSTDKLDYNRRKEDRSLPREKEDIRIKPQINPFMFSSKKTQSNQIEKYG